jgi:hypothetical protein
LLVDNIFPAWVSRCNKKGLQVGGAATSSDIFPQILGKRGSYLFWVGRKQTPIPGGGGGGGGAAAAAAAAVRAAAAAAAVRAAGAAQHSVAQPSEAPLWQWVSDKGYTTSNQTPHKLEQGQGACGLPPFRIP